MSLYCGSLSIIIYFTDSRSSVISSSDRTFLNNNVIKVRFPLMRLQFGRKGTTRFMKRLFLSSSVNESPIIFCIVILLEANKLISSLTFAFKFSNKRSIGAKKRCAFSFSRSCLAYSFANLSFRSCSGMFSNLFMG